MLHERTERKPEIRPGHEVSTLRGMGAGLQTGPLLARASARFDAFITVDQNIRHQQGDPVDRLAIIILRA